MTSLEDNSKTKFFRSQVNDVENMERVDWATIQIVETHDDEGRIKIMSGSQMFELLGLRDEGTPNIPTQGFDRRMDEQGNDNELGQDIDGAAIPILMMSYQVRLSFHIIRTTHQWRYRYSTQQWKSLSWQFGNLPSRSSI